MALESYYGAEIRRNLSYFPVWMPGEAVAPGDVGILRGDLFHKETTLRAIFPQFAFETEPNGSPRQTHFFSKNCMVGKLNAKGRALGHGKASLSIDFSAKGGVVFDAADCVGKAIKDIRAVTRHISAHRSEWPDGMALVTHVETSARFAVLISESEGARVELTGDVGPLAQVRIADASVAVSGAEGLGFQRTGKGPVALRLYGFKWWSSEPRLLEATEAEEKDFVEFSARDPIFDQGAVAP